MYAWTSSICVPRYRSNRMIKISTCPFFNGSTSLDEEHLTLRQHPSICISGICNRCCIWAKDPTVVYSRCSQCCARLPVIFSPADRDCCTVEAFEAPRSGPSKSRYCSLKRRLSGSIEYSLQKTRSWERVSGCLVVVATSVVSCERLDEAREIHSETVWTVPKSLWVMLLMLRAPDRIYSGVFSQLV